jgi:hypothetical protein
LWLALPLALYGGWQHYGLPHVIWAYTFRENGAQFDPFAKRYYLTCTFVGPYGVFRTQAENGRCGWVRFFKQKETR